MVILVHDRPPGRLTILQAPGKRLTKVYEHGLKGQVVKRGYDKALWFTSRSVEVKNVDALADLLRQLQRHPDACVIMGVPGKWHPGEGRPVLRRVYASHELADDSGRIHKEARKGTAEVWQRQQVEAGRLRPVTVLPAFEEQATRVLLLDFDGISAPAGIDWRADFAWTAAFLRLRLPAEFHGCRCVHYATSSAADLTKPDLGGTGIRMRLGFMLDRGVSFAQAKRWLAGIDGLDACTLRPAQPIYTAAPLFRDGLTDPLPERLGVLDGDRELVAVPEITIEQRFKREEFTSLGPARSAEGLGLLKSPRLDEALEKLAETDGEAGGVRSRLMAAAFDYAKDVGRNHVDIEALADLLADVGKRCRRSEAEVAGYGLESMIAWALERSPEEPAPKPHYPDNGLPAEEAAARLKMEMAAAVGAAVAWTATASAADPGTKVPPPPVRGIKAGAGIGKTAEAITQIAAIPGVEQMNIEIYVPDHRLAMEMAERVRAVVASRRAADFSGIDTNAELRVLVIRGRGALDTDGEPMCQKAELAEEVGRAGLDVKHTLCIGAGGLCEFAEKCRHLGQFRDKRPAIRIMAHTAMFVRRNKKLPYPDLIVVDEAFWKAAIPAKPVRLALDRLTETGRWRVRPRKVPKAKDNSPAELAREATAKAKARREAEDRKIDAEHFAIRAHSALFDGRDPRTVVTAEDCKLVAGVEWGSREGPGIDPGMLYAEQQRLWASWQGDECAKAGRFWSLLAAEHAHPGRPMQRIVLERDALTADDDRRHILDLYYRRELMLPGVPVILLDADLDPVIAAKFFWTDVRMVEIPVRQQAEIIQVCDRSCSMRFLLGGKENDQQRADRRLAEVQRFAGRVLAEGGLFVSYKAALERMTLPAGVDAVHLGNLRGRDGYKHHDVAIVAGHLEPSVEILERLARCMFGDEAEPIATVAAGSHGGTRYPNEQRRYRMASIVSDDAAGPAIDVSVHPDPRAQALLEQVRERELEQAVARLRLVHRDRPATVCLLTNIPLNLEIAIATTWNALARDREAEACHRWAGVWLASASERATAAPDLWGTAQAAENGWRRRKGVPSPSNYNLEHFGTPFSDYPGAGHALALHTVTLVEYRYPGQRGSAHKAFVPGVVWRDEVARANLEAVTGPVASVVIVRTVHCAPIVDAGEPEPLHIPIQVSGPFHVIDVDEAWAFAGHDTQRWTLFNGKRVILPVVLAGRFALARRCPDQAPVFTRDAA